MVAPCIASGFLLMLRARSFKLLLLAFMALWLGVIVPVHTRGQIKLAGAAPVEGHSCCAAGAKESSPKDSIPCSDRQACAVCYFIATLDLPPVFELNVQPTGLVCLVELSPETIAPAIDLQLPIHERAPPAV